MPWHISERGGGAEVQANYLSIELVNRGFLVYYICQTKNKLFVDTETVLNGVNICWLKPSGVLQWIDQKKYYKKLEFINPDIIVQRMSSNVTYTIGKFAKNKKIPLIWICTDNHSPSRRYFVENFKKKFDFNLKNSSKYLIFLINAIIMDYFRNKGMDLVDIAFTQNQKQENSVKLNFKKNSHRMISGHPLPKVNLSSSERFSKKTILWAANWGNHKRPELFMEIAREMICTPYRLVMLGGHSDKVYESRLITGCPKNIEIKGQISFEEASEYFDYSSILINTSVSEGFSNTYIQSWLRGIPTIVFGADPDQVIRKKCLGFDVNTVSEAVDKINNLLTSENIYDEISQNCLTYAKNNHSIEIMTNNFLTVIQNEGITLH